jgi:hypothetical protein
MIFTGDTLLIRKTGRTDFQQGSPEKLFHSIKEKIYTLPENTKIYPGHDYTGQMMSTVGEEKKYTPEISSTIKTVFKKLKIEFPYTNICVWNTSVLNEFMQHQPNHFFILVETDKETTNSVFYFLREIKKSVFIEPTNDILEKYNLNERETFIIKPIISEAPTQNINGIETVTIEKMLVDIFCDDVIFSAQQGGEMRTIFKNAFEKYTINQSKMLRYADRRRKKEELNQFIKTISNLWFAFFT